jgi:hypothetical protein
MWARTLVALGFVVTALACGGATTGDVVLVPDHDSPPPVAPIAVTPPPEAVVDAAPAAPTDDEIVAAYLADCHHVFASAVTDDMNDPSNECTWREFDQNCAPDPSGCWDKGQSCQDACGETCDSCQDLCAGACDTCKSACGEDATCLKACAEARSTCRDGCVGAKDTCQGATCPAAEAECNAAFEATKAQKCPECAEITQCFFDRWAENDYEARSCVEKFSSGNAECLEWCHPGQ